MTSLILLAACSSSQDPVRVWVIRRSEVGHSVETASPASILTWGTHPIEAAASGFSVPDSSICGLHTVRLCGRYGVNRAVSAQTSALDGFAGGTLDIGSVAVPPISCVGGSAERSLSTNSTELAVWGEQHCADGTGTGEPVETVTFRVVSGEVVLRAEAAGQACEVRRSGPQVPAEYWQLGVESARLCAQARAGIVEPLEVLQLLEDFRAAGHHLLPFLTTEGMGEDELNELFQLSGLYGVWEVVPQG